ncbi:L-rhamnonate dehydratase [Streptomyces sulfonofaciens]|uniref:L-rhamnonate dehydratase n=1 Tax=Streptomyces sulfonofaciens TaxID=68272 RepID=A0A919KU38_9ACTN|nr:enolase C-terminal domain-like protein [Streptomyces sulfonofaciens]GHH72522.1 L-rhamnonate dehydratase [Streptomyces sulfonofaciens]
MPDKPDMTISSVEVQAVRGPRPAPPPGPGQSQVKPLHIYPEHRPVTGAPRSAPPGQPAWTESLYLRIGTDAGPFGFYGPIDREAAWPIVELYADFLIGQDPLAGTIVWDKLYRLDRHSRHGHLKIALSAVDNALWDLRGRAYDVPVWRLLGGSSRTRVPAYASTLGTTLEPDTVRGVAARLAEEGFAAQKWFLARSPQEGWAGLRADVELAETVRDALGPGAEVMFDAFMGWDLHHATTWAREVERLRPRWLEEPFSPTQYGAFTELHRATRVPLAAGEHLYDRADVLPYLRDGVLSVLQTDPEWCGGVTELVRICAVAEPYGVPVIPHGHGLHAALHVVASQPPATCPMVEYLVRHIPARHHFEANPPTPVDGCFPLPTGPGFGIELDPAKTDSVQIWNPA